MPQYASLADIAILKNDAYRAERKQDWDLAQQLWIRVLAAVSGQDIEAIEALQNLGIQRYSRIHSQHLEQHLQETTTQNLSPHPPADRRSNSDNVHNKAVQQQYEIELLQQQLELKRIEASFLKAKQKHDFESQLIDAELQGYLNAMQGEKSSTMFQQDDFNP
jgi:hypothetical protein